jgi:hypothetical protein
MERRSYSIQNLISYLTSREQKLETSSSKKKYTTFCNSLSIKLIQLNSLQSALEVCIKAVSATKSLPPAERLWPGKILTLNILSYISYKQKKLTESLKSLYDSQFLLQQSKEHLKDYSIELYILTNFLTFLCLWKLGRKQESNKYFEVVKANVISIRKGTVASKLPLVSIENFYGIVFYIAALLKIELEGNYREACLVCEQCLAGLGEEIMARSVLRNMILAIKSLEKNPYGSVDNALDEEIESIFFISMFIPLMNPKIPEIKLHNSSKDYNMNKRFIKAKRSSSKPSSYQDYHKIRTFSNQFSPSNRPTSSNKRDQTPFDIVRPGSSNGYQMHKRVNKIYL